MTTYVKTAFQDSYPSYAYYEHEFFVEVDFMVK